MIKKVVLFSFALIFSVCTYAQNFNFLKKITPPNVDSARVAADLFGFSVAISGNYAVVGAHNQDWDSAGGNYKINAGAAYVFERRAGTWGLAKKLTPPNTDSARCTGDGFGRSVAISGDYLVVGAGGNNGGAGQDWDSAGGNYKADAGAVYVFERNNGNWGLVKKLTPPNTDSSRVASDIFGGSVGISGNYLIVGAVNQDYDSAGGNTISNAGAAYIFERRNGVWGYAKKLSTPTDRTTSDLFGYSVAVSGDYAIVGAPQQDYDSAGGNYHKTNAGAAYLYERGNGVWNFTKKITPPNTDSARVAGDLFGYKVAIDGTTLVVGAYQQDYDSAGTTTRSSAGAAYIFERNSGTWGYIKKITPNNSTGNRLASNQFGISLGISGNNIAVGANQNSYDSALSNSVTSAGSAYVFEKRNGVWEYAKKISTSGTNARLASDFFGSSIAISGNYIIGGCASTSNTGQDYDSAGGNYKSNAGAAFIFENMLSLEYNNGWVGASPGSGTENYNCYVTAGTATISSGAIINSLSVSSGATASLSGDLNINNNYTNNGTVSGGTVVLTGNSTHEILGTGSTQNLTLNNTAGGADVRDSLKINGILTLSKGVMWTNDKLKLEATGATTYGQIAGTGSGTTSGNLTAEYVITGGGLAFRPICSPLTGATVAQLSDDFTALNYGTPDTNYCNIWKFDESTSPYWTPVTGTSHSLDTGAVSIYMGGSSAWAHPLPITMDITGAYAGTGDYTVNSLTRTNSVTNQTGWHYIRNPWPSGFLWNGTGANVTANAGGVQGQQVWIYNQSAGAYRSFDNTTNGVIPPFHPFTLEVTSNNSSLTFLNSGRNTDSLLNYFDKTGLTNFIGLTVADSKGNYDIAKFYTDDQAINGYDGLDGNKMMNTVAPNLYFVLDGKNANKEVWNTVPQVNEPVFLNFKSSQNGKYTISFVTENLETNVEVELEDKQAGTRHNITKGSYQFLHDSTNTAGRFQLHFKRKSSVGIEEVKNDAFVYNDGSILALSTANAGVYTVEVIDLLGRTIVAPAKVETGAGQPQILSVNGVAPGYYLVKVSGTDIYKTFKVYLK